MQRIGVIGTGTMGIGIAQVAAQQGLAVVAVEVDEARSQAARENLQRTLDRLVERGRLPRAEADAALARIQWTTRYADLAAVEAVIEAVPEAIGLKHQVFRELDRVCSADALLATNTSSLSVTEIGSVVRDPSRVLGLHFFNPVPLMALVEIVRALHTSAAALERARELVRQLGKTPVEVADTPGFIVNRVARPFYNEALRLLGDGVADAPTIDRIMKQAAGFRMGPFELMDLIGHDVNFAVTSSLFESYFGEPRYRPSYLQQRLVKAGLLGRKTGQGVYTYER
jgi:3-hydroxybutyryl-CoA dehydrogenase